MMMMMKERSTKNELCLCGKSLVEIPQQNFMCGKIYWHCTVNSTTTIIILHSTHSHIHASAWPRTYYEKKPFPMASKFFGQNQFIGKEEEENEHYERRWRDKCRKRPTENEKRRKKKKKHQQIIAPVNRIWMWTSDIGAHFQAFSRYR